MDRLGVEILARHARVFIRWARPVRYVRLQYEDAFKLAKKLVEEGQKAEVDTPLAVDRNTPVILEARFRAIGDEVSVDFGVWREIFDLSPAEAFAFANALVITGERAQRFHIGLILSPVEQVEEYLEVGMPRVVQRQTLRPKGIASGEAFGKV